MLYLKETTLTKEKTNKPIDFVELQKITKQAFLMNLVKKFVLLHPETKFEMLVSTHYFLEANWKSIASQYFEEDLFQEFLLNEITEDNLFIYGKE